MPTIDSDAHVAETEPHLTTEQADQKVARSTREWGRNTGYRGKIRGSVRIVMTNWQLAETRRTAATCKPTGNPGNGNVRRGRSLDNQTTSRCSSDDLSSRSDKSDGKSLYARAITVGWPTFAGKVKDGFEDLRFATVGHECFIEEPAL
jgi:hypothetical protein